MLVATARCSRAGPPEASPPGMERLSPAVSSQSISRVWGPLVSSPCKDTSLGDEVLPGVCLCPCPSFHENTSISGQDASSQADLS